MAIIILINILYGVSEPYGLFPGGGCRLAAAPADWNACCYHPRVGPEHAQYPCMVHGLADPAPQWST